MNRLRLSRNDAFLLLMTVIWGVNFSIVKVALGEIPPLAFNSLRLGLASLLFLLTLALCRRSASAPNPVQTTAECARADPGLTPDSDLTRFANLPRSGAVGAQSKNRGVAVLPVFRRSHISLRDWLLIAVFGLIGHFVYQASVFSSASTRPRPPTSSLILGCSPVVVALLSAALGHERVRPIHWAGAALSVAGIYAVVGRGAHIGGATLGGDVLTMAGLVCWGVYTVGVRGLLDRHSPLEVTGYSMAIGTVPYVLLGIGELRSLRWGAVDTAAWAALVFSAVFALFVAYLIWYVAVSRIGNIRTAMYSNLTPIAALVVAVAWLGEHLTSAQVAGACAILAGMVLTRLVRSESPQTVAPAEE